MPVALLAIRSAPLRSLSACTVFQLNVIRFAGELALYEAGGRTPRVPSASTMPPLSAEHVPAQATNAPPLERMVFEDTETFAESAHTFTAASGVGRSPCGARLLGQGCQ